MFFYINKLRLLFSQEAWMMRTFRVVIHGSLFSWKLSAFMRSRAQTRKFRALKFLSIKIHERSCVHAFKLWHMPHSKSFCVHAFVRSNQESQSSKIFCHQNICAFVPSRIQTSRYGSIQIELRPKTSAFMRSCAHTSKVSALKFFGIKISMRSCVHAFRL